MIDTIIEGDCLEVMPTLPDKSIDMILCDLPYGVTTRNQWDIVIPFGDLWRQYDRIIRDKAAIILTASQPFTTDLINSNRSLFRYSLVWDKQRTSGQLNANRMPLRAHEDILVFYKSPPVYNPQMVIGPKITKGAGGGMSSNYGVAGKIPRKESDHYYPRSILSFKACHNMTGKCHPTEKPVALFEYLIKTYTNEGDLVLDNCIGSGTTAIAARNTGRHFIGIEKEPKYVEIANKRLSQLPQTLNECLIRIAV